LLTTASDFGDLNNFSGNDAVPRTDVESFLGLPSGSLGQDDFEEGSAIQQTFDVVAGQILKFDYNFLTVDSIDFAFVVVNSNLEILADTTDATTPSGADMDPIFGDPTFETGWQTFSLTLSTDGPLTLGIGVMDQFDEFLASGLLVDNVRLVDAPSNVVPEPSSLVIFGIGLLCCSLFTVRRRRRSSKLA
jgi:hypothetical protein